jgi:hypothetical protein
MITVKHSTQVVLRQMCQNRLVGASLSGVAELINQTEQVCHITPNEVLVPNLNAVQADRTSGLVARCMHLETTHSQTGWRVCDAQQPTLLGPNDLHNQSTCAHCMWSARFVCLAFTVRRVCTGELYVAHRRDRTAPQSLYCIERERHGYLLARLIHLRRNYQTSCCS